MFLSFYIIGFLSLLFCQNQWTAGQTSAVVNRVTVFLRGHASACDRDDHLEMTGTSKPATPATWTTNTTLRFSGWLSDKALLLQLLFLNHGQPCPVPLPRDDGSFQCCWQALRWLYRNFGLFTGSITCCHPSPDMLEPTAFQGSGPGSL